MLLLGIAAVAGLVWFAARWREQGFEWEEFAQTWTTLHPGWLAAATAFALSTYVGRALRWRVLLLPVRPHPNLWNLISATTIGFTAIVLFGRPGEFVRPYLIAIKEEVPFSSQLAAWLVERIYDLLTALLIFGFALTRVQASGLPVGPNLAWILQVGGGIVAVVCSICLILLIMLSRFSETMRNRLLEALAFLPPQRYAQVERLVTSFTRGMSSTRRGSQLGQLVAYSLLEWALIVACYVCICRAFPGTAGFSLVEVVIFVGFVSFGCIVQIPGVGGGMQLAAIVVLTELFGLTLEASSSLALLLWVVTFVVVVPIGLLLAFHEGLTWSRLRAVQKEATL